MDTPEQIKGTCSECDGHLQFPPGALGQKINCPHCGEKTVLRDPSGAVPVVEVMDAAAEPGNAGDTADDAKGRVAGFAKAAAEAAKKASEKVRDLKDSEEVQALKEKAGRAVADVRDKAAAEAKANPAGFRKKLIVVGAALAVVVVFLLFRTQPWKSDFDRALLRANRGEAKAQHLAASFFLRGDGVEKNGAKAVEWYSAAAEQGFADSLVTLGSMYLQGFEVEPDPEEGFRRFMLAAELDDEVAKSVVGELLWRGQGVARNPGEARKWLEESDDLADSLFFLGLMHATGEGVEQHVNKAIDLLEDAADLGHADAGGALGFIYATDAEEKDEKKAVKFLTKGSEAGSAQATHLLGLCHLEGFGVRTDRTLALNLVEKASSMGCSEAENSLRHMDNPSGPSLLASVAKLGIGIFDPGRSADYDQHWERYRR